METLQDFFYYTKSMSYLVSIPFVVLFLGYYLFALGRDDGR